MLISDYIFM